MKKTIFYLIFFLFLNSVSYSQTFVDDSYDINFKTDTINREKFKVNFYNSLIKAYENEQKRCEILNNNILFNNFERYIESAKWVMTQDTLTDKNYRPLYYNESIINRELDKFKGKDLYSIYIILYEHNWYNGNPSQDYFLIVEAYDGYHICNVNNKVKRNFKRRLKKDEFFNNFIYYFKQLKTEIFELPRGVGSFYIMITQITKSDETKEFVFESKVNEIMYPQEEVFLKYILGFKNDLSPEF